MQERFKRIGVLMETLAEISSHPSGWYERIAQKNLFHWSLEARLPRHPIEVINDDWGEVAARVTRTHGICYAVLNMANGNHPGGGYLEGVAAQEENMFRRTDCHYSLKPDQINPATGCYRRSIFRLIKGKDARVFLDYENPRICLRGKENRSDAQLGYRWIGHHEIFPFYELRSAAPRCLFDRPYNPSEMERRIGAQLDTLKYHRIRHVILGAFGCGAFRNPAEKVARLYRKLLQERAGFFDHVVFAIYDAGYGPDNYTPFASVFSSSTEGTQ